MEKLINTGRITALSSFIIGTILLSIYLYFDNSYDMVKIGLFYVIITAIINGLVFLTLLTASALSEKYRIQLLKTCGIIMLNIPIAIGYFYLVLLIEFPTKG